ncbi:hypothetical protein TSUD_378670 [Trifolium subterraneum]|uniref:Uncharacterized protein n=1 Tax=Trifolium subterraneum TaxID=3900 RepID=A0A2Z6N5H0_TRISU|nr:hypothetical protein TSUD_378670 [Trifolium subterraneum]
MFIPNPITLSSTTSQRHPTASTSARPAMREQQGSDCGEPTTTCAKSFNRVAQARISGQIGGGGGDTVHAWAELSVVKKKMLRERMRMVMDATLFEPILQW